MRTAFAAVLLLALLWPAAVLAQLSGNAIAGWERDSPYNKLYTPQGTDIVRGKLVRVVEISPLPGMARGYALLVETRKNVEVEVHLGPQAYIEWLAGVLAPGDRIKAMGAWAKIGGARLVFMASKVRRNESLEVKLRRSSDGRPYWTLKDEQTLEEKLED